MTLLAKSVHSVALGLLGTNQAALSPEMLALLF